MPAEFRVEGVRRVPIYGGPSCGPSVAVAPENSVLRGEIEVLGGDVWLCIDLAESHPLRIPGEREACWICAGQSCTPPPIVWAGVKHARAVGQMLDLQWERPFGRTGAVDYRLQMQPRGMEGSWDTIWHKCLGEEFGSQRVEVTIEWPYGVSDAKVCIRAAMGNLELASAATGVRGRPKAGAGAQQRPGKAGALAVMTTAGALAGSMPTITTNSSSIDGRVEMLDRAVTYEPRVRCRSQLRHIVLRQALPPAQRPQRTFSKAVIMGLYHSCTTLMALEVQRCFKIPVLNRNDNGQLWKHRVHHQRFAPLDEDTFVIIMVKEPFFWLQSLVRNFYEVHPLVRDGEGRFVDATTRGLPDLLGYLEHDRTIYPDAVALWSDAVATYLDDDIFPASASAVVRAEDFLFHFDAVTEELAATWSLGSGGAGYRAPEGPRRQRPTKTGARSREEALAFYSDPANRKGAFSDEQAQQVAAGIDPQMASLLGYAEDAVSGWVAGAEDSGA